MNQRLRIAHLLQWFELGGGESVALQLAGAQREAGHQVLALSLSSPTGPLADEFRARGIEVCHVSRSRDGFDPSLYPRLLWFFTRSRLDVVHCHDPQSLVYGAAPARVSRAAVVYTKHGVDIDTGRRLWLSRGASVFLDAFVAVSEKTAQTARENGEVAFPNKVAVIENGIDLSRFGSDPQLRQQARASLGLSPQTWVVGTVGRVEPVKNHARLLTAITPLLGDAVALVIVGDGSALSQLREQREALPEAARRAVHLVGMRRDVDRILSALDAFAISSDSEGLPLALLEAMAAGLPTVSTPVGGIPSLLDGAVPAGLLVDPQDPATMTAAFRRLHDDADLAATLGRNARQRVEQHYSLDVTASQYMTLYDRYRRR